MCSKNSRSWKSPEVFVSHLRELLTENTFHGSVACLFPKPNIHYFRYDGRWWLNELTNIIILLAAVNICYNRLVSFDTYMCGASIW